MIHPVTPSHTTTSAGVKFNIQDVLTFGRALPLQDSDMVKSTSEKLAQRFYAGQKPHKSKSRLGKRRLVSPLKEPSDSSSTPSSTSSARLEAHSLRPGVLCNAPPRTLTHIALHAFAHHYPMQLRPDDIWLAIVHGVARHIFANAEKLRTRFVNFSGKKEIEYENNTLSMGNVPVPVWEEEVFPFFSDEIRKEIGPTMHALFVCQFSTSTKVGLAACDITLMATTAAYFEFTMMTKCGVPSMELCGTLDDWKRLRESTEKLRQALLDDFADMWLPPLLEVLDEFVEAYEGRVNLDFWQGMVKRSIRNGSGQSEFISGWINNLYPYLANGTENRHVKHWQKISQFDGNMLNDYGNLLSSVQVQWKYYGKTYPMHFHAGYVGMAQDNETLRFVPKSAGLYRMIQRTRTTEFS